MLSNDTDVDGDRLTVTLVDGPDDSWVYPYASVVNQSTGDPSYFYGRYSGVGVVSKTAIKRAPSFPETGRTIHWARPHKER